MPQQLGAFLGGAGGDVANGVLQQEVLVEADHVVILVDEARPCGIDLADDLQVGAVRR